MKKIKLAAALVWLGFTALISPAWLSLCYMSVIGYGKGYAYDLREERDLYILLGWIMLVIWAAAVLPAAVWLGNVCRRKQKWMWSVPVLLFAGLFVLSVTLVGWDNFLSVFVPS